MEMLYEIALNKCITDIDNLFVITLMYRFNNNVSVPFD